jgi:hypothetical protein
VIITSQQALNPIFITDCLNFWCIRSDDDAVGGGLHGTLSNAHNHGFAMNISQWFAR